VRDHFYWAPLICLLCGLRPEEVLRLLKLDVFERDGILCFRVEQRPESGPKTESSERVVPLPETLLRLGFREWWFDSFHRPGPLLFPGATTGRRDGKASGTLASGARPSGLISGSPTGTRTDTRCAVPS